jgi:RNA polymerase sigma factor (sigma-70 family)
VNTQTEISNAITKLASLIRKTGARWGMVLAVRQIFALSPIDKQEFNRAVNDLVSEYRPELIEDQNLVNANYADLIAKALTVRNVPRDRVDDMYSEVFLKLLKLKENIFSQYDPDKSAFQTYLVNIVHNIITDLVRSDSRKKRKHVDEELPSSKTEDSRGWEDILQTESNLDYGVKIQQIYNLLEKDPEARSKLLPDIFKLFTEGKTRFDVGEELDLSPATMSRRVEQLKHYVIKWL